MPDWRILSPFGIKKYGAKDTIIGSNTPTAKVRIDNMFLLIVCNDLRPSFNKI